MSLVTAATSTPAGTRTACAHCASPRVMRISMTLTDGTAVDFASCLRCERKTWSHGGGDLSVTEVLAKAKKPAAPRR